MGALVTFIAPAFNEPKEKCVFVISMLAQTDPNWKAIIFHNGENPGMRAWVQSLNDERFVYEESTNNTGAWGCHNRQLAITHMVDTKYVINTSIQDYWVQNAVALLNPIMATTEPDFIHWQAINHLFNYGVLTGEIAFGHIDWGQWATKTEFIKTVGIQKPEEFSADWHTLQELIKQGQIKGAHKIDRIFTIHN